MSVTNAMLVTNDNGMALMAHEMKSTNMAQEMKSTKLNEIALVCVLICVSRNEEH